MATLDLHNLADADGSEVTEWLQDQGITGGTHGIQTEPVMDDRGQITALRVVVPYVAEAVIRAALAGFPKRHKRGEYPGRVRHPECTNVAAHLQAMLDAKRPSDVERIEAIKDLIRWAQSVDPRLRVVP